LGLAFSAVSGCCIFCVAESGKHNQTMKLYFINQKRKVKLLYCKEQQNITIMPKFIKINATVPKLQESCTTWLRVEKKNLI
jgi:hypothetical protein